MRTPLTRCFRSVLVSCVVFVAARPLGAEEPAKGSPAEEAEWLELPSFVVEGVRDRPERLGLGGMATVGPEASLPGALAAAPGLVSQDGGDGFYPPRLGARGSGLQSAPVSRGLQLRVDSLPLNAADGAFNLAVMEPGFFGTFTFQPGAACFARTMGYNAGVVDSSVAVLALGGAVDFGWWIPSWGPQTQATFSVGGDGFVHAVARSVARGADDPATRLGPPLWAGGVAYTRSDGWRPNSGQERTAAVGRAEWWGPGRARVALSVYAARAALGIPGPLTLTAAQQQPASITAQAAAEVPQRTTDFARLALHAQWPSAFEAAFGVQATDDEFRQLRANGISDTRGVDGMGRVAMDWSFGDVKVSTGVLVEYGERRQERYANVGGRAGPRFADLRLRAGTLSAWADAEWTPVRRLSLKGGFSVLAARREGRGTATAAGSVAAGLMAPHLELAAFPTARRRVEGFVRAARGAEAPTFDDLLAVRGTAPALALGWTPLRLQTADTLAAGCRGRFGDHAGNDWISYEFTAYTADWRHELLRLADATGAPRGTVNAGPTRHRGLESAVRWRLRNGERPLDLAVTHTWSDARFAHDGVNGANHLAGLPPQAGSAQLTCVPVNEGVFAVFGAGWIWGRTYADHGNRLAYGGHTLVNAKLGWKAQRWTLALEVNNCFDRRYIASTSGVIDLARTPAGPALFLPGSPRRFVGSCEWRW